MALQNEIINALSYATSKGYQIHPDAFAMLKGLDTDVLRAVREIIKSKSRKREPVILVDDIKEFLNPNASASQQTRTVASFNTERTCEVLVDPTPKVNTAEGVLGYTSLFRSRFEKSMKILSQRPDSRRIDKIASIKQTMRNGKRQSGKSENRAYEDSSLDSSRSSIVAGLVMFRRAKKNGAVELEIDDYTGILNATAASEEAKRQVTSLAMDQLVMLEIENAKGMPGLAIKSAISPDIPEHIPNTSKSESYAVLISDLHVGSKYFMRAEFMRFLEWLSNSDNDDIVSKIKFLCIGGDIIDGIGIFPNQDKELLETDTSKQMASASALLSKVPKHIKMLIIPGNHDPGRRALPQPALPIIETSVLRSMENCVMLGNPALVQLDGVKVLMYHGQSLDDVIATTPGLSYGKPAEAMKMLLKARHLSPTYGGRTPIAPEIEDMMVITEVPDIFHSGHVHVTDLQNYRGTLIVNSGAWQSQTKFQQTMGIMPTPGIAILVNLSTLQPIMQDFNQ